MPQHGLDALMRRISIILALAFLGMNYHGTSQDVVHELAGTLGFLTPVFEDDFETDSGWMKFEEIVGGSPCYSSNIGSVTRTMDVAYYGSYSLLVWVNQARSTKSNHVIAYKQYSNRGQFGIWRYQIHAYIPLGTVNSGQTGPEFSMQNTRETISDQSKTATAGIQYVANITPEEQGQWNVWREVAPGIANWHPFITRTLQANTWYTLTVEADYSNNSYRTFSLQGGGLDMSVDLSAYRIAEENKSFAEAFVITVEAENRWNNCGSDGIFDYQIYYDLAKLESNVKSTFLPVVSK